VSEHRFPRFRREIRYDEGEAIFGKPEKGQVGPYGIVLYVVYFGICLGKSDGKTVTVLEDDFHLWVSLGNGETEDADSTANIEKRVDGGEIDLFYNGLEQKLASRINLMAAEERKGKMKTEFRTVETKGDGSVRVDVYHASAID